VTHQVLCVSWASRQRTRLGLNRTQHAETSIKGLAGQEVVRSCTSTDMFMHMCIDSRLYILYPRRSNGIGQRSVSRISFPCICALLLKLSPTDNHTLNTSHQPLATPRMTAVLTYYESSSSTPVTSIRRSVNDRYHCYSHCPHRHRMPHYLPVLATELEL
jgi:hypothetical protein